MHENAREKGFDDFFYFIHGLEICSLVDFLCNSLVGIVLIFFSSCQCDHHLSKKTIFF